MAQKNVHPNQDIIPMFQLYKPKPPLSAFIEMFWYYEASAPTPSTKERVLPTGTVEFVIRLTKDSNKVFHSHDLNKFQSFSGAVVTGTQSKFFVLDKSEQDTQLPRRSLVRLAYGKNNRRGNLFWFERLMNWLTSSASR